MSSIALSRNLTRFSLNEIQLIGSVSKIEEIRKVKDRVLIDLDVVTNERFRNEANDWVSIAEYHHCFAQGKKAEEIAQLVIKGAYVWVRGAVKTVKFSSRGEIKNKTQIQIKEWSILSQTDFRESQARQIDAQAPSEISGGQS